MECYRKEVERLTENSKKFIEETKQKIDFYELETFSKVVNKEYQKQNNFHIFDENDGFGKIKGLCKNIMINGIGEGLFGKK